jgi:MoaA/NifB/PqqE/SkfB family radical SAM enzyme
MTYTSDNKDLVGAQCELKNDEGTWTAVTPATVMVHRSNKDLMVKCTKSGFSDARANVVSKTKGNMFGNIIFGGGEPLLIKDHERFITKLVESGASKNIELRYHTNGTIMNEKFIELWNNFKEVEIMVSLDDWGTRNDYVRYPANWEVVSKNLDRLDETGNTIIVSLLTTVHAMNIYNLPDFAQSIIDRKWKKICKRNYGLMSIGTTHWPKYMSTTVLPKQVKDKIIQHWESFTELNNNERWKNRIKSQIEYMNSVDESSKFPAFMDYINKLDSIRPIKFAELYADYYRILNDV